MNEIQVGDRERGRDVSGQCATEGLVLSIAYPAGWPGCFTDEPNDQPAYRRRYRIDTGKTYPTGGKVLAIVECAEVVAP